MEELTNCHSQHRSTSGGVIFSSWCTFLPRELDILAIFNFLSEIYAYFGAFSFNLLFLVDLGDQLREHV